jgi:oligopeptide/dipeptide ABC transporter ATP-binding protein
VLEGERMSGGPDGGTGENGPQAPLLDVRRLSVDFAARRGARRTRVRVVHDVSFTLGRGKTLGLVGESGSGKTSLARAILRLIPAGAGDVFLDGESVLAAGARRMQHIRRRMQIVFQDPVGSLNPRMTVGQMLEEPIRYYRLASEKRPAERVAELLRQVGLDPDHASRYPHEFSGGQRQRIGIARALAVEPDLIICDEPVSALDVSVQAQVLNLLRDLQAQLGLSYIFISHSLAVVEHFCHEVAVMYLGRIVEKAPTGSVFRRPAHPYTAALLSAAPRANPGVREQRYRLGGEVPSAWRPPEGCAFHPRCSVAQVVCSQTVPVLEAIGHQDGGHHVACLRSKEIISGHVRIHSPQDRP